MACSTAATCGATACDATTAACQYADNTTVCTGTNDVCDGNGLCCGLANGGSISVDSATGDDTTPCCGTGKNGPCQTITRAMQLIDAVGVQHVTINATVDGGGGDWNASEAQYPIELGWGVELSAPGVFFYDPVDLADLNQMAAIFEVKQQYSSNDTVGTVSIVGTASSPIGVGMSSDNSSQTEDDAAINVDNGAKLYIANATVNSSTTTDSEYAIRIYSAGAVVFGQDESANILGTVQIGNSLGQAATDGRTGIYCLPDTNKQLGCTITDATYDGGESSVTIQGQESVDINAPDYSTITLTSNPIIGVPPSAIGFGECPVSPKGDGQQGYGALYVSGPSTVTLKNGTIQCTYGMGVVVETSAYGSTGNPSVTFDKMVFQNTDMAIYANAGTVTVTNSMLRYNYYGVQQSDDGNGNSGGIDLSGGGNRVVCSSNAESSQSSSTPGVDVYNNSTAKLKADNVVWDTSGPDYFDCDSTLTTCTCNLKACTVNAGSDGMDAVEDSTNLGGISTTGNTQLDGGC
jgi:hypothetical protein